MGRKFVRITRLVAVVAAASLAAADGAIAQGRTGAAPSDTEIAARADEYLTAASRASAEVSPHALAVDSAPAPAPGRPPP